MKIKHIILLTTTLLPCLAAEKEQALETIPHYQRPMIRDLMQGFHTTLQDEEGKTFYILTSLTKLNGCYNQGTALYTQMAALYTQGATVDTQWTTLATQWDTVETQKTTLSTQRTALKIQWDTLHTQSDAKHTQYAALYDYKHLQALYEEASEGIEQVRKGKILAEIPKDIRNTVCSFLDEKRGLNIYQAAINDAAPYIITLTMATTALKKILQEAT